MPASSSMSARLADAEGAKAIVVRARDVYMDFGARPLAVDHASFELETGTPLTIPGPSGSGKTTLLRMIHAPQAAADAGGIVAHGDAHEANVWS